MSIVGEVRPDYRQQRRVAGWRLRTRMVCATVCTAVLFSVGSIVMLAIGVLTGFRARRFYTEVLARCLARCALTMYGVKIREHRDWEFSASQTVYISNHTSTLDVFVIIALGLPNTRYFLSGFLRKIVPLWIVGQMIQVFWTPLQSFPQKRTQLFQRAETELRKSGGSVFLTPEGQVTWRFNKGAFHLAMNLQAPIQPIYIQIPNEVDPGPWLNGDGMQIRPGIVQVHYRPLIDTTTWQLEELERNRDRVKKMYWDWHCELGGTPQREPGSMMLSSTNDT